MKTDTNTARMNNLRTHLKSAGHDFRTSSRHRGTLAAAWARAAAIEVARLAYLIEQEERR